MNLCLPWSACQVNQFFVFGWVALVLPLALEQSLAAQTDFAAVIKEAEKSLVRIEVQGIDGGGLGSGFVVTESGRLVTNVHVLAGAQKAHAIFPNDNTRYEITHTTHIDEGRDICIAQLKTNKRLVPIKLAAKLPSKGENIIGLGSPLGLSFTATRGIVSAVRAGAELARDLGDDSMRGTWLQVDVALSPGNSGGPLINSKGEVVAMSTRASQGVAQNLNFGISVKDIREAIDKSKGNSRTDLASGVGKIEDHDVSGGGSSGPESIVSKKSVPSTALNEYLALTKEDYKVLAKRVRADTTEQLKKYKQMKVGSVGIPGQAGADSEVMILTNGRVDKYFFRSDAVKRRRVRKKEDRVNDLKKLRGQLTSKPTPEAISALAKHAGPALDPQEKYSVGFMTDAVVLHSFNDHEVVVLYDNSPFLMWVESTAGLSPGQEISPTPVFVSGTQTIELPGQASTLSVTTLQTVTERELNRVFSTYVASSTKSGVWRDASGKYEIEAELVKNDGKYVHLKKANGKIIKVALSKLDSESRKRASE
jgi:S1-C subfamily serine protease